MARSPKKAPKKVLEPLIHIFVCPQENNSKKGNTMAGRRNKQIMRAQPPAKKLQQKHKTPWHATRQQHWSTFSRAPKHTTKNKETPWQEGKIQRKPREPMCTQIVARLKNKTTKHHGPKPEKSSKESAGTTDPHFCLPPRKQLKKREHHGRTKK